MFTRRLIIDRILTVILACLLCLSIFACTYGFTGMPQMSHHSTPAMLGAHMDHARSLTLAIGAEILLALAAVFVCLYVIISVAMPVSARWQVILAYDESPPRETYGYAFSSRAPPMR